IFRKTSSKTQDDHHLKNFSKETYQQFFNLSSDMICILSKEGIVIDINQTCIDLLKYNKEELVGRNIETISANKKNNYDRHELNDRAWNYEKQVFIKTVLDKENKIIPLEVLMQR